MVLQPHSSFHSFTRQPNSPSPVNPKLGIIALGDLLRLARRDGSATGAALSLRRCRWRFCSGVLVGSGSPGRGASPLPLTGALAGGAFQRQPAALLLQDLGSTSGRRGQRLGRLHGRGVAAGAARQRERGGGATAITDRGARGDRLDPLPLRLRNHRAGRDGGPRGPPGTRSRRGGPPAGPSGPPGPPGGPGARGCPQRTRRTAEDRGARAGDLPSYVARQAGWGCGDRGRRGARTPAPPGSVEGGRRGAGRGAGTNASCSRTGSGRRRGPGRAPRVRSRGRHGSWGAQLCPSVSPRGPEDGPEGRGPGRPRASRRRTPCRRRRRASGTARGMRHR